MTDPIVLNPGDSTTVTIPYEVTVNGEQVANGNATQVVNANPAPATPWRVTSATADADIKEIQKNVKVTADGLLGDATLAAIKAAVKPNVSNKTFPILLGSSTPPSGVDPNTKIEPAAQALDASLGAVSMWHRTYFLWGTTGVNSIAGMKQVIANDIKAGRASYVSLKPPGGSWGGWNDVLNGTAAVKQGEAAIAAALKQAQDAPEWMTFAYSFHHEAENDRDLAGLTEAQKQAHRDLFYNASVAHYDRLRSYGLPDNVVLGPTWMNYTLTTEGANKLGTLSKWHKGSDHFDFIGFDDYPTSWDDNWAFAQAQKGRDGQPLPIAFGEYGQSLSEAGNDINAQADYLQKRLDWLNAHRGPFLVGACWWNVVAMKAPALAKLGDAIKSERSKF